MKNDYTIDVIIPCAGNGVYFEAALDSVLNQTNLPDKIYVVDNVSGHGIYSSVIDSKKSSLIEYIKLTKRLSMTENWQYCLGIGKSMYFAFLHDDDIWEPNYLKDSIEGLSINTSSSIVLTAFHVFIEGLLDKKLYDGEKKIKITNFKKLESMPSSIANYILCLTNSAHMSALFFKRAAIGFPINSRWMPDQFFLSSYLAISDIALVSKTNVHIRLSSTNVTSDLVKSGFVAVETISYVRNLTEFYIRNKQLNPRNLIKYTLNSSLSNFRVLKQATFSWPLNPLLLQFGMSLIKEERLMRKQKYLLSVPVIFIGFYWIVYSIRADFKYYMKDCKRNRNYFNI